MYKYIHNTSWKEYFLIDYKQLLTVITLERDWSAGCKTLYHLQTFFTPWHVATIHIPHFFYFKTKNLIIKEKSSLSRKNLLTLTDRVSEFSMNQTLGNSTVCFQGTVRKKSRNPRLSTYWWTSHCSHLFSLLLCVPTLSLSGTPPP